MTCSLRSVIPGSTWDHDIIAALRAQGPGWQSRMNEALRKAAGV
ncbi:BrnA antitoxin family protein [Sphingomonas sp.]|nr:BrnA antitoxin family protein [Sphingomonas sp.]